MVSRRGYGARRRRAACASSGLSGWNASVGSVLQPKPSWLGVALLILAGCVHSISAVGAGLFVGSVALLLSAAGAVICLGGFAYLRVWTFPFLLSLFMLPKLAIVYNQVTLPLQLLSPAGWLKRCCWPAAASVTRDGNIIDVGGHKLLVAEAYAAESVICFRSALSQWSSPIGRMPNRGCDWPCWLGIRSGRDSRQRGESSRQRHACRRWMRARCMPSPA